MTSYKVTTDDQRLDTIVYDYYGDLTMFHAVMKANPHINTVALGKGGCNGDARYLHCHSRGCVVVENVQYLIQVNGVDVTDKISPHLTSMQVTDNDADDADELTLVLSKRFQRPNYLDEIQVFLGFKKLRFVGLFHVQTTQIIDNQRLTSLLRRILQGWSPIFCGGW